MSKEGWGGGGPNKVQGVEVKVNKREGCVWEVYLAPKSTCFETEIPILLMKTYFSNFPCKYFWKLF